MPKGGYRYAVRKGDSLWHVAKRVYGDATLWWMIRDANLRLLYTNGGILTPGMTLAVPLLLDEITVTAPRMQAPRSSNLTLARGTLFVVVEQLPEVGSRWLIRKVVAVPMDINKLRGIAPYDMTFEEIKNLHREGWPERFGMSARGPEATQSMARHALGDVRQSPYISASNKIFGAATMEGRPVLVDISRAAGAGFTVHSVPDLLADLERLATEHPALRQRVETLKYAVQHFEGETLVEGHVPREAIKPIPAEHRAYITAAERLYQLHKSNPEELARQLQKLEGSYHGTRWLRGTARVVTVVGVVFTVKDVAEASQRSLEQGSFKPITAEALRQAGGWGMGFAGAKIGFAMGAAFGIETGPGALATGMIGAMIFGCAGYMGADWLADMISPN